MIRPSLAFVLLLIPGITGCQTELLVTAKEPTADASAQAYILEMVVATVDRDQLVGLNLPDFNTALADYGQAEVPTDRLVQEIIDGDMQPPASTTLERLRIAPLACDTPTWLRTLDEVADVTLVSTPKVLIVKQTSTAVTIKTAFLGSACFPHRVEFCGDIHPKAYPDARHLLQIGVSPNADDRTVFLFTPQIWYKQAADQAHAVFNATDDKSLVAHLEPGRNYLLAGGPGWLTDGSEIDDPPLEYFVLVKVQPVE